MTYTDPYNQEIVAAASGVVERLAEFVGQGLAESFWASLNYSDAALLAELAASTGDLFTARGILSDWADNDEDSDEHAEAMAAAIVRYTNVEEQQDALIGTDAASAALAVAPAVEPDRWSVTIRQNEEDEGVTFTIDAADRLADEDGIRVYLLSVEQATAVLDDWKADGGPELRGYTTGDTEAREWEFTLAIAFEHEIGFESWGTYWSADREGGLPTSGFPFHLIITETPA